ncbi:MAG: hypothetical protein ACI976_000073 [Aureispira sp.]|jgi:hypothetical protein
MKTKSNLLNYISHLLNDDDALHKFTIDPITEAEGEQGLTKAERAVLRRTVQNLSNSSTNGYSIVRNLGSYRRSLRLLQNVLTNTGHKMAQDVMETTEGQYTFSVQTFFPPKINSSNADFTCQNNNYVKQTFGSPYGAYSKIFTVKLDNINPSIKDVMDASGTSYEAVDKNGMLFVSAFNIYDFSVKADISNDCYDLAKNPNADSVFWFYSINGKANRGNSGSTGESFANVKLKPNDTVIWQLIAPDSTYGFHPCAPHEQNEYAKTVKQKA